MNILLVRPDPRAQCNSREPVSGEMGLWPPLALQYLAAAVESAGHSVTILDGHWRATDTTTLQRTVRNGHYALVGVTGTIPEIPEVRRLCRDAKGAGALTVVGGGIADYYTNVLLADDFVDFVVAGDGEPALLALADANNLPAAPELVPGLAWRDGAVVRRNASAMVVDLDTLPEPRHDLSDRSRYSRPDALSPLATMITTRGCSFRCGFCARGESGRILRLRSPEAVVEEMARLAAAGVREIIFANDSLLTHRQQITTLAELLARRRLPVRWQGAARVDQIDADLLRLLKGAGCVQLKFGVESGAPDILRIMNKGITVEQVRTAFRLARAAGIRTGAYFIVGYVGETSASVARTIALACEIRPDYLMFYPGIPLPGTLFWDETVRLGLGDPTYWDRYGCGETSEPLGFLYPEVPDWLRQAYRATFGSPAYLARKLFDLAAWRALLRNPRLVRALIGGAGCER